MNTYPVQHAMPRTPLLSLLILIDANRMKDQILIRSRKGEVCMQLFPRFDAIGKAKGPNIQVRGGKFGRCARALQKMSQMRVGCSSS